MAKILVQGIKLYGYHGCMEEEGKIGRTFIVDIAIESDLKKASLTDKLSDTINYVTVYEIVKQEMAIRSKLMEHVAKRIYDHLRRRFPQVSALEVKVTKLDPPINGIVDSTSVVISG
jgi:dihydroneopterin aldolase